MACWAFFFHGPIFVYDVNFKWFISVIICLRVSISKHHSKNDLVTACNFLPDVAVACYFINFHSKNKLEKQKTRCPKIFWLNYMRVLYTKLNQTWKVAHKKRCLPEIQGVDLLDANRLDSGHESKPPVFLYKNLYSLKVNWFTYAHLIIHMWQLCHRIKHWSLDKCYQQISYQLKNFL